MGPRGERVVGEREAALEAARASGVPSECLESDACPWEGLLASIDGYSAAESRLPWMSWADWGWKAAVASASDLAASGAVPGALLVSIGTPDPLSAVEIARGVGEAASWMDARVLGGDLNACRCRDAWVDVTALGRRLYWSPRWAAKPGDVLVRAGPLGYGAVATAVLSNPDIVRGVPVRVIEYTKRPKPPIFLPLILSKAGCPPRAGIDNSDGWAETLWLLAEASNVKVVIDSLAPSPEAGEALRFLGLDPEVAVPLSAEDYTLLLAVQADHVSCVLESCREGGIECEIIGRVEAGVPSVVYKGEPLPRGGWDSFRSS